MNFCKTIITPGQSIAEDREPLICVPLVGRDQTTVLGELTTLVAKQPDLIEWRIDYFSEIADTAKVVALAQQIRYRTAGIPIVFTRRSIREGGEPIALSEDQVLFLHEAVLASRTVDFVDYELSSDPVHFQRVLTAAHAVDVQLIASFHDFQRTPSVEDIVAKFTAAERAGADIAKVAVMPTTLDDVLTLLSATLEGHRRSCLPIISISMGAYGALSRLLGWMFGSSVTFAVGGQSSAPGQLPIADLREVLAIVKRALANRPA